MAVAEFVNIDASESFSGTREATRLRLTAEEARNIRYVLSEWSGDVVGSSSAAQLEQLASDPVLLEPEARTDKEGKRRLEMAIESAWKRAWEDDEGEMHVSPSHGSSYHGWEMTQIDRWSNERQGPGRKAREERIHAWRTLKRLAESFSPSLIILNALYGDVPPGLPMRGLWDKTTDQDYRRVVRYVPESGGSGAALEALLHVDRRRLDGESFDAQKARLTAATAARTAVLSRLGQECEKLIVRASVDYREAWRAAS